MLATALESSRTGTSTTTHTTNTGTSTVTSLTGTSSTTLTTDTEIGTLTDSTGTLTSASGTVTSFTESNPTTSAPSAGASITGAFTLTTDEPEAFVQDPAVREALTESVALQAGVPSSYVTVRLSIGAGSRRLQSTGSSVQVSYEITVPIGSASSAQDVHANIANADTTTLTSLITESLNERKGSGAYSVVVASITEPTLEIVETVATTSNSDGTDSDNGVREILVVVGASAGVVCGVLVAYLALRHLLRWSKTPAVPVHSSDADNQLPEVIV